MQYGQFFFIYWQEWIDLLGFIARKYFRYLVCSFAHSIPKNTLFGIKGVHDIIQATHALSWLANVI